MRKHMRPTTKPATRKPLAERAKSARSQRRRATTSQDPMLAAYYEKMLKLQHGACAVCQQKFGRKLKIDRHSETGALRGLLCAGCIELVGVIQHVWKYRHRFYAVLKEWHGEDYARAFWRAYRCDIPDQLEREQRASVH